MKMNDYEVFDDLNEYEDLLETLKDDEAKLLALKKYYESKEIEIINNTDFKSIYGANNDKVRKAHVKKELKNTVEEKEQLTLKIDNIKRRLSYLKYLIGVKTQLIGLQVK